MNIHQSGVLFQHQGQDIYLITLKNKAGIEITISNLGGIIRNFNVPVKGGKNIDIVLGFDKLEHYLEEEYVKNQTYLGAMIGRYANRIANGSFEIDGQMIRVSQNIPPHQLHGGIKGFNEKVWKIEKIEELPNPKISLSYLSKDGEEGFPGNLDVRVNFELTEKNELIIETQAFTDKPTAINLTHHGYFNLNGAGSIGDHLITIPAAFYLAQDIDYVTTGEQLNVEGTAYDFRREKRADQNWEDKEGYDQSFVLDKVYDTWGLAASAYSESSGIKLEVFTDEPTVHFYTGKYLNVKNGKAGKTYTAFTGFCFETQHHTNAVNIPRFPNTILRPGEVYKHTTSYCISTGDTHNGVH